MVKMIEIKQLPIAELKIRLRDMTEELANLKFQLALHQVDNPVKIRMLKRDVARLKTVLHEYELGIRKESKPQN
jgi:large subunit ribosomal protein L29